LHSTIETDFGALHAAVRKTDDYPHTDIPLFSDWTVSRYEVPWITSDEDVKKLETVLKPPGDTEYSAARDQLEELNRSARKFHVPVIGQAGFALNGVIHTMGVERALLVSADDPGLLESLVAVISRVRTKALGMTLDLGVTTVIRNGWYDSADFWSPAQFERWVMPGLEKDISTVHQAGGIFVYQMCTGIGPLLPLLARLDFDCLLELEPALGTTSAAEVKAALPGKTFWGGVSAPVHLERGDPSTVRRAVQKAFGDFGNRGFILKAVPSIRAHVPEETIGAFFDEWRKIARLYSQPE
jgi:hypothetical protein